MHSRWLLGIAILGTFATVDLGAQGRVTVRVGPAAPPARPGPSSPPSIDQPFRTIGIMLPPSARMHRPMLVRSSTLGLFVFDPYCWLDPAIGTENVTPAAGMAVAGPTLSGGLQLDVEPRRASVYVDGVLVGTVDQFKGYFQHLEASAGAHVITFLAPGYEPLTVGVTVVPNKTTTYRGFLDRR